MENTFVRIPEFDLRTIKEILLINKRHKSDYKPELKGETQDILSVAELLDLLDDLKVSYEELEAERDELVYQIENMNSEEWEQE